MNIDDFERLLNEVSADLTVKARSTGFANSKSFEEGVLTAFLERIGAVDQQNENRHPFAFPDFSFGQFGVEVKFTSSDSWRSVANSVFETFRNDAISYVYVVFGKMGGTPEVRWGRYEECVMHVRTSHLPRFELEIGAKKSLFDLFGVSYRDFCLLPLDEKMRYIRSYARSRLKPNERLWWLEEKSEITHTLPIEVRLYINLSTTEKSRLRAEATLLCPQIVKGARAKGKYNDVAIYLLTYHGVLATQARDLFSAGSVAHRKDKARGGNYIRRALEALEDEMSTAALEMEDALFVEYWGESVPPESRIVRWLEMADGFASGWTPSEVLFRKEL